MVKFKKVLIDIIEDNRLESLIPSREYTENEQIYMRGYTQALEDMLEDFNASMDEFYKDVNNCSLN
tara:strand:- start:170 stop:367 length:198 start_codon:yes stop_codon:yes gene_type:complete